MPLKLMVMNLGSGGNVSHLQPYLPQIISFTTNIRGLKMSNNFWLKTNHQYGLDMVIP